MATITELDDSRAHTVSRSPEEQIRALRYLVEGTESDTEVMGLVELTIPQVYLGQVLRNYRLNPLGCGVWFVEVNYGRRKPPGKITFDFDTTGERIKVTQALSTPSIYVVPGPVEAPVRQEIDFKGGIEVKRHGGTTKVEGCEIVDRKCEFTVKRTFGTDAIIDGDLVQLLFTKTGLVNSDLIQVLIWGIDLTFNPGELLFMGARGAQANGGANVGEVADWEGELAMHFAFSPNRADISYDFLPVDYPPIQKEGWDYLWISYADDISGTAIIPAPLQINVEQVYERAALAPLFFGGQS